MAWDYEDYSPQAINTALAKNPPPPMPVVNPPPVTAPAATAPNYFTDPSGAVVAHSPRTPWPDPVSAAHYGPDVAGGSTFGTPLGGGAGYQAAAAVPEARMALSPAPRWNVNMNRSLSAMADAGIEPSANTPNYPYGFAPQTASEKAASELSLAKTRAELAGYNARERADLDARDAAIERNIAWANANDPRRQFDASVRNAYVDARLAQGLRRPGGARLSAAAAQSPMFGAGPANQPRNYLAEAGAQQQLVNNATQSVLGERGTQMDLAGKALTLQGQQRINDLAQKITTLSGKDLQNAQSQMLALLGKDKPEEWKAIRMEGRKGTDPQTLASFAEPDRVLLHNARTGEQIMVGGGGAAPAAAGPKPTRDEFLKRAKLANPGMSLDELGRIYEEKYK